MTVPLVAETQARYSEFRMASLARGGHSPNNRGRLNDMLDLHALPGKCNLSKANRAREQGPEFVAACKQHPAVESAVNSLEHRGSGRFRSHGCAVDLGGQSAPPWFAAAALRVQTEAAEKALLRAV